MEFTRCTHGPLLVTVHRAEWFCAKGIFDNCGPKQGTTGSPAVSPVDERLDQIGAVCFDAHVHYAPPPCAFRPHPARSSELREEIMHMVKRQEHEIERKYCSSPSFNDYLHEVQEDTVEVAHRRKVFEWNLEVRSASCLLKMSTSPGAHVNFCFCSPARRPRAALVKPSSSVVF